jgi:hypothetical protein
MMFRTSVIGFVFLAVFLSSPSHAYVDPDKDLCGGSGGCFYWDQKQCIWSQESDDPILLPNTLKIKLKQSGKLQIVGQIVKTEYTAPGYLVELKSKSFGSCGGTEAEQCTVLQEKVEIKVKGPTGTKVLKGTGYCGS